MKRYSFLIFVFFHGFFDLLFFFFFTNVKRIVLYDCKRFTFFWIPLSLLVGWLVVFIFVYVVGVLIPR